MITGKTTYEKAILSIVRIETQRDDTGKREIGTGFLFEFSTGRTPPCPVLVTNKHLVKGASKAQLLIRTFTAGSGVDSSEARWLELDDFEKRWIGHQNGDVDLCVMPVTDLIEAAGPNTVYVTINIGLVPSKEDLEAMFAVEEVYMVGYPVDIWDSINNVPLFRKGITATPPFMDFNAKPCGLIDIACVSGASGSPVMILREGRTSHIRGTGTKSGQQLALLLGIHDRKVDWNVDTSTDAPDETNQLPAALSFYIKASELSAMEFTVRAQLRSGKRTLAWEY